MQEVNDLLDDVTRKLVSGEQLSEKNIDHALTGKRVGHRECQPKEDLLSEVLSFFPLY